MSTDHAATSRALLERLGRTADAEGGLPTATVATAAQVHATLALAHEMRTANLIAAVAYIRSHDIDLPDTLEALEDAALDRLGLDSGDDQ